MSRALTEELLAKLPAPMRRAVEAADLPVWVRRDELTIDGFRVPPDYTAADIETVIDNALAREARRQAGHGMRIESATGHVTVHGGPYFAVVSQHGKGWGCIPRSQEAHANPATTYGRTPEEAAIRYSLPLLDWVMAYLPHAGGAWARD